MTRTKKATPAGHVLHAVVVVLGALAFTLIFFLVLPFIQAISKSPTADLELRPVDSAVLPPPPPPPVEEEPEEEKEPEEKPPELLEDEPLLDLSQLELALGDGVGGGWGMGGDLAAGLRSLVSGGDDVDSIVPLDELDQKPRPIYQPSPMRTAQMRKQGGTVYVLFTVDQKGRVEDPIVRQSSDPIFERPALAAVKKWRFEPGQRNGEPVRFRMGVPITFPEG